MNSNRLAKIIWVMFGLSLIIYSVFLLQQSSNLTYEASPSDPEVIKYVVQRILIGLLFLIAVINIFKIPSDESWITWIFLTGFAARVLLIPTQPILEDDYYRYLWDGAVSANGINPYKFSPEDVMEKKDFIPEKLIELSSESGLIIERINHPHIRTIYPVFSQFTFAVSYLLSPFGLDVWKLLILIADLLCAVLIFLILKKLKLPLVLTAVYWLNPIVIHEFMSAAHMDVFAILFVTMSAALYISRFSHLSIVLLGFASGFKIFPLVLLPIFLRRYFGKPKRFIFQLTIFAAIFIFILLPVVFAGVDSSLGFVKYAQVWTNNAGLYNLLKAVLSVINDITGGWINCTHCVVRYGVVIMLIGWISWIIRKKIHDRLVFFESGLLIAAVLFLLSPTQFPWYYTWVFPFLTIRPRLSFLIYPVLLPLYQLNYLWEYFIYVQHIPVIILFTLELIYPEKFNYFQNKEKKSLHRHINE